MVDLRQVVNLNEGVASNGFHNGQVKRKEDKEGFFKSM